MNKYSTLLALTFVLTCASVPAGFITTKGSEFMLDGKPFYFAGANCYDMFTYGSGSGDPETQYMNKTEIDDHFKNMYANGVRVVRTWGFNHQSWHGFNPKPGEYNEPEFMLFDYILVSAKKHGLKLIVTLENYWTAYGGINTLLQWAGKSPQPNSGVFFSTPAANQYYLDYVKYFITRQNHYTNISMKSDPTIMAWEVMNEPRHQGYGDDLTSNVMRSWMDNTGKFIKALDPNHLISSGLEGHGKKYGFGGNEGNDFVKIHSSPYIDFCSAHPYPTEGWANLNVSATQNVLRMWSHDCQVTVGKPMVIGEFNVQKNVRQEYWSAMFDVIEQQGIAGDLFWWFENRQVDGEYGVMVGDPILQLFEKHSQAMAAKN